MAKTLLPSSFGSSDDFQIEDVPETDHMDFAQEIEGDGQSDGWNDGFGGDDEVGRDHNYEFGGDYGGFGGDDEFGGDDNDPMESGNDFGFEDSDDGFDERDGDGLGTQDKRF